MLKLSKYIKLLTNGKYTLPYCNCLLIEDDVTCLVDSSPPDEEMQHLEEINIDLIVNSHGHSDHNSRNHNFPQARVLLHPDEHERVVSGEVYLDAYGFAQFPIATAYRPFYLDAVQYHPRSADGDLHDGQVISTGHTEFQVLHLPGHTSGHCGFVFPQEGFVFTADINLDTRPFYAMIDSDLDDFLNSLGLLERLSPDMIVSGHGNAVTTRDIPRKLATYRDAIYQRDEAILKLVKAGCHTVPALAEKAVTFDGKLPEPQGVFLLHECIMDWKHLQRLERLGEIICDEDKYYVA